jgi:2-methylisocitrate lyase-like PEP mutase family enzyme
MTPAAALRFQATISSMPDATLKSKAIHFLRHHKGPHILLLPNAWDAASARVFETSGFSAVGTSSAGIAYSLGYRDGQRIPREEMLAAIGRIARAVATPVTADVEAGYGTSPDEVGETVRALLDAGAVGMNLEDAASDMVLFDLAQQVERVQAAREAATAAGVPVVINARTDVYLMHEEGDAAGSFDEALRRLSAYRDAGANCLFLPGVRDGNIIARMVRSLGAPLNVLAGPGLPSARDLENIGVARLSLGSGPMRAAMGLTRKIARELLETGTCTAMLDLAVPYREMNELMR